MLLILSYQHLPRLKCSAFVNLAEISVLAPLATVFYNSTRIRPVQHMVDRGYHSFRKSLYVYPRNSTTLLFPWGPQLELASSVSSCHGESYVQKQLARHFKWLRHLGGATRKFSEFADRVSPEVYPVARTGYCRHLIRWRRTKLAK